MIKLLLISTLVVLALGASTPLSTTFPVQPYSDQIQNASPTQNYANCYTATFNYLSTQGISVTGYQFSLAPFFGDPDIYIDYFTNQQNGCPRVNSAFAAATGAGDILTIPYSASQPSNTFVIGINSTTASTSYLISAFPLLAGSPPNNAEIQLSQVSDSWDPNFPALEGIPFQGMLNNQQYMTFTYTVPAYGINATFTVSPIGGGDPDIFINLASAGMPSQTNHQYSSQNFGADFIHIPNTTPNTTYYVSVYAWTGCTFNFLAYSTLVNSPTQTAFPILMDGEPVTDLITRSQMQLYNFFIGLPNVTITITATPVGTSGGDPDLYVFLPTATSYTPSTATWKSLHVGADTITIPPTDPHYPGPNSASSFPTSIVVGVYGYVNTIYSVSAATMTTGIVIPVGTSFTGQASYNSPTFFRFANGDDAAGLLIQTLPVTGGSPVFYVSTDVSNPGPQSGKWDYSCTTAGGCFLFITPAQSVVGTYYIGVYAPQTSAMVSYTISVSSNYSTTILSDGVPQIGNAPRGYSRYFSFFNSQPLSVSFTVGALSGDPDLYISTTNPYPNNTASGFTWRSFKVGSDSITIPTTDPNYCTQCTYYVAAYAYRDAIFTMLAYTFNTTVALVDSVPVADTVNAGQYHYYTYQVVTSSAHVVINLDVVNGNTDADLYLSFNANACPNILSYDRRSSSYGGDEIIVDGQAAGVWCIAVYGYTNNASYILTASQDNPLIPDNFYLTDTVVAGGTRNYHFIVQPYSLGATVTVTTLYGNTNLYLNTNGTAGTTAGSYNAMDNSWPGNSITVTNTSTIFIPGSWSVCVQGVDNAMYQIAVTTFRPILAQGVPMYANVQPASANFYLVTFASAAAVEDQYISVKVYGGIVSVWVSQQTFWPSDNTCMGPGSVNCWYSTNITDHFIHIPASQINTTTPFGQIGFFIGVWGGSPATTCACTNQPNCVCPALYDILSYGAGSNITLAQDQPVFSSLNNGQTNTYKSLIPSGANNWVVNVQSCNNNPIPSVSINGTVVIPSGGYVAPYSMTNPQTGLTTITTTASADLSTFLLAATANTDAYRPIVSNSSVYVSYFDVYFAPQPEGPPAPQVWSMWVNFTAPTVNAAYGPLTYRLFMVQVSQQPYHFDPKYAEDNTFDLATYLATTNMLSPCALDFNVQTPLTDWIAINTDSDGMVRFPVVNVTGNGTWVLNVAVQSSLGLRSAYFPVIVSPPFEWHHGMPGGTIFLLIVFIPFIVYMVGGMIYNRFRLGKTGMDMIPNREAWGTFFGYVSDGFAFLKGKITGSGYAPVVDSGAGSAGANPFARRGNYLDLPDSGAPAASANTASRGGYGAL